MPTQDFPELSGGGPPSVRRDYLRALAELGDVPGSAIRTAVRLATPGITATVRDAAWADLVSAVATLDAFRSGGIDVRDIVPHGVPAERYTVAFETLERDIDKALDELVVS